MLCWYQEKFWNLAGVVCGCHRKWRSTWYLLAKYPETQNMQHLGQSQRTVQILHDFQINNPLHIHVGKKLVYNCN